MVITGSDKPPEIPQTKKKVDINLETRPSRGIVSDLKLAGPRSVQSE